MKWFYLLLAVLAEVVATSALGMSDNFTKLWPSVFVIVGYSLSVYLLSLTLEQIPIGLAYAIWAGSGMALITIAGFFFFKQSLDFPAILGISLILAGVIIINLFSRSAAH